MNGRAALGTALAAMSAFAALPTAAFECVAAKDQVRIEGSYREQGGAGDLSVECKSETSGFMVSRQERTCTGAWSRIGNVVRYRRGDLLFQVQDPDPTNRFDGCKQFAGWECYPSSHPRMPADTRPCQPSDKKVRIFMDGRKLHYEVVGRPAESGIFLPRAP